MKRAWPFGSRGEPATEPELKQTKSGKENDDILQLLLETLDQSFGDGILLVEDGVTVFVNSRFEQLTGFQREELIGSGLFPFVLDESRFQGTITECHRSGAKRNSRFQLSRTATVMAVSVSFRPFRDHWICCTFREVNRFIWIEVSHSLALQ